MCSMTSASRLVEASGYLSGHMHMMHLDLQDRRKASRKRPLVGWSSAKFLRYLPVRSLSKCEIGWQVSALSFACALLWMPGAIVTPFKGILPLADTEPMRLPQERSPTSSLGWNCRSLTIIGAGLEREEWQSKCEREGRLTHLMLAPSIPCRRTHRNELVRRYCEHKRSYAWG